MLIGQQKPCDTLLHPRVAPVDPPWLDTTHFLKCMYTQDIFCCVVDNFITKVLILLFWKRGFLYWCAHNIYIHIIVYNCTHTYLLIYFMKQSPSWETDRSSATQEIPCTLWYSKVHYGITPFPLLTRTDPVYVSQPTFRRSILILSPIFTWVYKIEY